MGSRVRRASWPSAAKQDQCRSINTSLTEARNPHATRYVMISRMLIAKLLSSEGNIAGGGLVRS